MGVCDIIFRAKRIDDGEWVEGFLFSTNEHAYIAYPNQFDDDLFLSPNEIFIEVDPETVCQYTGLTDKNGRKIFESDIVRGGKDIYIVFWSECNYEIGIKNKEESMGIAYVYPGGIWVIGNIFDNPELIGE